VTSETCPRCQGGSLIVEGYIEPGSDGMVVRAHCAGCGYVWVERPPDRTLPPTG